MARIIAAVMGDSLGHLNQMSAVAHAMREHEFLFLGGGKVLDLRSFGFAVEELPVPATLYSNNRVDISSTVVNALKVFLGFPRAVRKVARVIKDFDPELILTSYEFFVPLVARAIGRNCVSIDNQHFLTKCKHDAPPGQRLSGVMFSLPQRMMFSRAQKYLVNTFFPLKPIDPAVTEVFPPLLAPGVTDVSPSEGDYVLVYQTSPTFQRLFAVLEEMPHRFIIYGFGERPSKKNLNFRSFSRERFVQELAGCRYAITNGGHTAISEALYFGKAVLAFPIRLAYEQFFNACMLRVCGYGDYSLDQAPTRRLLEKFEKNLKQCQARIRAGDFCGNSSVVARLNEIIVKQEQAKPLHNYVSL